jgi:hypothetical protein
MMAGVSVVHPGRCPGFPGLRWRLVPSDDALRLRMEMMAQEANFWHIPSDESQIYMIY